MSSETSYDTPSKRAFASSSLAFNMSPFHEYPGGVFIDVPAPSDSVQSANYLKQNSFHDNSTLSPPESSSNGQYLSVHDQLYGSRGLNPLYHPDTSALIDLDLSINMTDPASQSGIPPTETTYYSQLLPTPDPNDFLDTRTERSENHSNTDHRSDNRVNGTVNQKYYLEPNANSEYYEPNSTGRSRNMGNSSRTADFAQNSFHSPQYYAFKSQEYLYASQGDSPSSNGQFNGQSDGQMSSSHGPQSSHAYASPQETPVLDQSAGRFPDLRPQEPTISSNAPPGKRAPHKSIWALKGNIPGASHMALANQIQFENKFQDNFHSEGGPRIQGDHHSSNRHSDRQTSNSEVNSSSPVHEGIQRYSKVARKIRDVTMKGESAISRGINFFRESSPIKSYSQISKILGSPGKVSTRPRAQSKISTGLPNSSGQPPPVTPARGSKSVRKVASHACLTSTDRKVLKPYRSKSTANLKHHSGPRPSTPPPSSHLPVAAGLDDLPSPSEPQEPRSPAPGYSSPTTVILSSATKPPSTVRRSIPTATKATPTPATRARINVGDSAPPPLGIFVEQRPKNVAPVSVSASTVAQPSNSGGESPPPPHIEASNVPLMSSFQVVIVDAQQIKAGLKKRKSKEKEGEKRRPITKSVNALGDPPAELAEEFELSGVVGNGGTNDSNTAGFLSNASARDGPAGISSSASSVTGESRDNESSGRELLDFDLVKRLGISPMKFAQFDEAEESVGAAETTVVDEEDDELLGRVLEQADEWSKELKWDIGEEVAKYI